MPNALAALLLQHHGKNENGCMLTDYAAIPGLKVKASTTNGTSGLGVYRGQRVYWSYDHGARYDAVTGTVDWQHHAPFFTVEGTK